MDNNFINTRKKRVKYTFKKPPSNDLRDIEPNEEEISFFYQVASFPDPSMNRYHVRKFVISGNNRFLDVREYRLTKKQLKKFYLEKKPHEFKRYAVYTLEDIGYPLMAEIITSRSDILSQDYNYSGFAPF